MKINIQGIQHEVDFIHQSKAGTSIWLVEGTRIFIGKPWRLTNFGFFPWLALTFFFCGAIIEALLFTVIYTCPFGLGDWFLRVLGVMP
jgi:hypothetical protein